MNQLRQFVKEVAGRGLFFVVRGMEGWLSPGGLRMAFWPVAAIMASLDCWGDHRARPKRTPLGEPKFSFWRMRCWFHLNRVLEFIPDRMGSAKWLARCRFEGMAHVEEARRDGRPVVLAFVHAGPFSIGRNWLRAGGIPCATFVLGPAESRSGVKRMKDAIAIFPEVSATFHEDELKAARKFLAAGNCLMIAIDYPSGRLLAVPFEKFDFEIATGPIRLAKAAKAALVPWTIIEEGPWQFTIKFSAAVKTEELAEADSPRVSQYLVDELVTLWKQFPEQCDPILLDRLLPRGEGKKSA